MAIPRQLSLISRGPLFDLDVQRQYLNEKQSVYIPDEEELISSLALWISSLRQVSRGKLKESSIEQNFNRIVLEKGLFSILCG